MIDHSNPHKRGGYKHPHQKDGEVPYEASVPMSNIPPEACEAAEANLADFDGITPGEWHVGAQNDLLYITAGKPPSASNDHPDHEADRTVIARVYIEGDAKALASVPKLLRAISAQTKELARLREENERLTRELAEKTAAIQDAADQIDRWRKQARRESDSVLRWEERHNAAQRRIATLEQQARVLPHWKSFLEDVVTAEDRSNLDGDDADTVLLQLNEGAEAMLALLAATAVTNEGGPNA